MTAIGLLSGFVGYFMIVFAFKYLEFQEIKRVGWSCHESLYGDEYYDYKRYTVYRHMNHYYVLCNMRTVSIHYFKLFALISARKLIERDGN